MVIAHPALREIDINPLLADADGVIALDARIRVAGSDVPPRRTLSIKPYPVQWERHDTLPGIGAFMLRPIRPEDEHLYANLIERLSPQDTRLRFFMFRPHWSHQFIASLTQIDQASGALIGVARLIADPDFQRAEYAIIVASDLKGHGLGWRLMQHLIEYARHEGLAELYGDVLADNTMMLRMCEELGFKVSDVLGDAGVRRVVLDLVSGSPTPKR
jgi:acetyltransferase